MYKRQRYFYADTYEELLAADEPQRQLSKEFVREWLMDGGFQGKEGQVIPEMTEEFVQSVTERYIELYEKVTGETFVRADVSDPVNRIKGNVEAYLTGLKV